MPFHVIPYDYVFTRAAEILLVHRYHIVRTLVQNHILSTSLTTRPIVLFFFWTQSVLRDHGFLYSFEVLVTEFFYRAPHFNLSLLSSFSHGSFARTSG